jgi:hypothetical protein
MARSLSLKTGLIGAPFGKKSQVRLDRGHLLRHRSGARAPVRGERTGRVARPGAAGSASGRVADRSPAHLNGERWRGRTSRVPARVQQLARVSGSGHHHVTASIVACVVGRTGNGGDGHAGGALQPR